jgi:RHS repeat-associated protein
VVDTITQDGRTTDYALDVTGNRIRSWTDTALGATARVNHYDSDADSPSWTQETTTTYTRPLVGISELAGIYDSATSTVDYQITNLHGDVTATIHGTDTGLTTTQTSTEYGTPINPTDIGTTRYGWLGNDKRAADAPAGITLMGVRLYNPTTGRFLQEDPVYGGNANPYDYCYGDPVNCSDTSGMIANLPRLSRLERNHCARHPWQCSMYLSISGWAATRANRTYPEGGLQNAFRHCIWSAQLTYRLGHRNAWRWNEAHENGQWDRDSVIDRENNVWGRGVGDWARIYYPRPWQRSNALDWICKRCKELVRDGFLNLTGGP